jgi:hypothetical protein
MKEDILEQLVDDYLQSQGYFTRHNVKFRPRNGHPEFVRHDDSVSSDIDVIGLHPRRKGTDRVWVVSCKSWQAGFNVRSKLTELEQIKKRSGRDSWRAFRELMQANWSEGFCDAVERETGSRKFTYVTAVTSFKGDRSLWEDYPAFRTALCGSPVKLISLSEMYAAVLALMTTTVAGSHFGRTIQLLKASGVQPSLAAIANDE